MFHVPTNTEKTSGSFCWEYVFFISCTSWQKASLFCREDNHIFFLLKMINSSVSLDQNMLVNSVFLLLLFFCSLHYNGTAFLPVLSLVVIVGCSYSYSYSFQNNYTHWHGLFLTQSIFFYLP